MPYYERILADSDIFQKMMFLKVSDAIKLMPIVNFEAETLEYLNNSNDIEVQKYLPGAFVTTIEEAHEKMGDNLNRGLTSQGLLYNITTIPENRVIGHILLHSPLAATGLDHWSIDFWIRKEFRRQKIILSSVHRMLLYMQQMQIKRVAAIVHSANAPSIKLLEGLGFGILGHEDQNGQMVYGVSL